MKILIARGTSKIEEGKKNAKEYPYWDRLLELCQDHEIKEISGKLNNKDLTELINWCTVWISIDSFLPHFVKYNSLKCGIVLWGLSDPLIFGYNTNINLLKDRKYLRKDQFVWWRGIEHNPEAFVSAEEVFKAINKVD